MVTGPITYCWPEAPAKARAAGELLRRRVEAVVGADKFDEWRIETIGLDACLGELAAGAPEPLEVTLIPMASAG